MNYVGTLLGLGIGLMFVGILVGILYYVAFSWSHMKALLVDCSAGTVGIVTVRTACYFDQPGTEHYILWMHLCEDVCAPGAES